MLYCPRTSLVAAMRSDSGLIICEIAATGTGESLRGQLVASHACAHDGGMREKRAGEVLKVDF